MKKIVVTGINGLIGQYIVEPLKELEFEVYGIGRRDITTNDFNYIKCDINNSLQIENIFNKIKPEYLINLAWDLGIEHYVSNSNFELLTSSLNMLKYFKENGGKKSVFIGTCLEYKSKNIPIKEYDELNPTTVYSKCKNYLREISELYCNKNNIDFCWCRVFYVYGENENKYRLFPYIINNLKENKKVIINHSQLEKDYIYAGDAAKALVKVLNSQVKGIINVCSGKGIKLGDFATIIAKKMNKEHLLELHELETNEPNIMIGDNTKLINKLNFRDYSNMEDIIYKFLAEQSRAEQSRAEQ